MSTDLTCTIYMAAPKGSHVPTAERLKAALYAVTGFDCWTPQVLKPSEPSRFAWAATVDLIEGTRWTDHERHLWILSSIFPGTRITALMEDGGNNKWRVCALDGKSEVSEPEPTRWPPTTLWGDQPDPTPVPTSPFESDAVQTAGKHIRNHREACTIIAALRMWQRSILAFHMTKNNFPEWDIATDSGNMLPLTPEDIDQLIERLQGV